jgi:exportin-T
MDICVRYCEVFETHHEYIPRLLESFIRLIHLDHVRIKKKSYYLFFRLVKHLRAQVGNVAETVIQSIADLLPIHAEAPEKENGADIASDDTNPSDNSLFWSQKHLFEAISYMCSTNGTPPEKQALYIRSVMEPIFADMEIHLPQAKAGDAQATRQIEYSVWALGMLAPGFSDAFSSSAAQRPVIPKVVTDEFVRAAEAILVALGELKFVHDIRAACRSAFNRLVNIIQAAVLPQLPQWIDGLLAWSSSKDEMAFFLRLLDQIVYGFKAEIYDILNLLLTPLLQRICNGLSEPVNGTDDEIQLGELRREYLTFILVILNNNLAGVLISEANQGFFETLVASILTVSRTIERNNSQNKLAFSVMTRMTQVWGGPDLATISLNPTAPTGSPSPVIPGFEQFLIERFHPACWEVMQAPQFRPDTDAQMKQLLNEIAALQQAIYVKTGEMYLQHVQAVTFPTLGINGPEFLQALTTSTDKKMFSAYLLGLIKGRR